MRAPYCPHAPSRETILGRKEKGAVLGRSHATTGIFAGAAAACLLPGAAETMADAAWLVGAAGGAALLPDIDHAGATVAKSLGPVTGALSSAANALFGGHRKGTHSLLGWALFAAGAFAAGLWTVDIGQMPLGLPGQVNAGAALLSGWLFVLVGQVFGIARGAAKAIAFAAGAALAWLAGIGSIELAAVVGAGMAIHCVAGDMLTVEGVPLLWPLVSRNHRLLVLGRTGSAREKLYAGGDGSGVLGKLGGLVGIATVALPTVLAGSGTVLPFLAEAF